MTKTTALNDLKRATRFSWPDWNELVGKGKTWREWIMQRQRQRPSLINQT